MKIMVTLAVGIAVALAVAAQAFAISGGSADHFSVLLLNGNTGKPISNESIHIGVDRNDPNRNQLRGKTDANGSVTFYYKTAAPNSISLIYSKAEDCSYARTHYSTSDVLAIGLVAENKCDASLQYSGKPKPGQLVVFAKPVSPWQRMIREL
jgi:hypothetical protein